MRRWPGALKTPPYVTAKPEVTHRTLSIPALSSPDSPSSDASTLRFLVLATDGLWDQLSSEDVVALVGGHLSGLKGSIPKSDLLKLVPTSTGTAAIEGKSKRRELAEGAWAFVDDNPGTHLIRNALGGANNHELRRSMSIPAPYSRPHRDDITVTVVWWEEGKEGGVPNTSTFNLEKPHAKL
jgi:pyruvate dehydrogenase phosphatase